MKNDTNTTLKQKSEAKHLALLKIFALCAALVLTVLLISACPNSSNGGMPPPLPLVDKTYTVTAGSQTVRFTMKAVKTVDGGTLGNSGDEENPPHNVNLKAYLIGETEVTQELWTLVTGNNPSYFQGTAQIPAGSEVQKERPVENMTWLDAVWFCNALTEKIPELGAGEKVYTISGANVTQDMSKKGFRLPTEAEWEWAAGGGNASHKWAGTNNPSEVGTYAWYSGNSFDGTVLKTHQVKQKRANALGLYDMSGNVEEWCWDWYQDPIPTDTADNPTGPASEVNNQGKVWRGGSYSNTREEVECTERRSSRSSSQFCGLRIVQRP